MYKIGDFSKITSLTIKALHYYDEQGILIPYRNECNGYRYYNENDIKKAKLIILLKTMGFGIAEIKEVLLNYEDESDLSYYLTDKKQMIENRINRDKQLIKKMESLIKSENTSKIANNTIQIKNIPPLNVAFMHFIGSYSETGKYQGKILSQLKSKINGYPMNCYNTQGYNESSEIEVCVPTTIQISQNEIDTKTLPSIKAISTIHKGNYDDIGYSYKSIIDYAQKYNLKYTLPTREIYIKGPGKIFMGNTSKYITEIQFPIL